MNKKIGIILLGHRDYQLDVALSMAREAAEGLRLRGWDVQFEERCLTDPLQARRAAIDLVGRDLAGVIYFLGTWIECPVAVSAVRELEHLPMAVWAFPQFVNQEGTKESTGSLVSLSVLSGALRRMGYEFQQIIGMPEGGDALQTAVRFCRVAASRLALKRARLGMIGFMSMGMYPGSYDHVLVRRVIGPEVVPLDTYTLIERMKQVEADAVKGEQQRLAELADVMEDARPDLEDVARMTLALHSLCEEHQLDGVNVKCQYELSQEYGCVACVPLSALADRGLVTGCEGDIPVSLSMLALAYLTGSVVTYADVLDWEQGVALMSACGFLPFSLARDRPVVRQVGHPGFQGPLVSAVMRPEPVTLFRINEGRGDFHANIAVGHGLPTEQRMGRFPALNVRLDCTRDAFFGSIESQHYAMCYGDVSADLDHLCRLLGVTPRRIC